MSLDRPLWVLVAAAAATYPALGLAWCVATLLTVRPDARVLGLAGHPGVLAALLLVLVGMVAVANVVRVVVTWLRQARRFHVWVDRRRASMPGQIAVAVAEFAPRERVTVVDTVEPIAVTARLLRPTVLLSTGLAATLSSAELRGANPRAGPRPPERSTARSARTDPRRPPVVSASGPGHTRPCPARLRTRR